MPVTRPRKPSPAVAGRCGNDPAGIDSPVTVAEHSEDYWRLALAIGVTYAFLGFAIIRLANRVSGLESRVSFASMTASNVSAELARLQHERVIRDEVRRHRGDI